MSAPTLPDRPIWSVATALSGVVSVTCTLLGGLALWAAVVSALGNPVEGTFPLFSWFFALVSSAAGVAAAIFCLYAGARVRLRRRILARVVGIVVATASIAVLLSCVVVAGLSVA